MAEIYRNQVVKTPKDLNLKQAQSRVRNFLKNTDDSYNGYIYVDGPTISDLFVVKKGVAVKCTSDQWVDYFRVYLFPIPQ